MSMPFFWFAQDDSDERFAHRYGPRLTRVRDASDEPTASGSNAADHALLAQLGGTDVAVAGCALETMFRAWYEPLLAFARTRIGDDAAAQDVVQEVFADLWHRRATLTITVSLGAYLHGAVRHRVLARHRDGATRARLLGSIAAAEFPGISPTVEVMPDSMGDDNMSDDDTRFRAVIKAADTLPPRVRDVFFLRWRQGLSYKEIAAVMGISVKTAEAQMTIALRRVREAVRGV